MEKLPMFADKVEDILFWVCKYQFQGCKYSFQGCKTFKVSVVAEFSILWLLYYTSVVYATKNYLSLECVKRIHTIYDIETTDYFMIHWVHTAWKG